MQATICGNVAMSQKAMKNIKDARVTMTESVKSYRRSFTEICLLLIKYYCFIDPYDLANQSNRRNCIGLDYIITQLD
jgi:hypothetical protein